MLCKVITANPQIVRSNSSSSSSSYSIHYYYNNISIDRPLQVRHEQKKAKYGPIADRHMVYAKGYVV